MKKFFSLLTMFMLCLYGMSAETPTSSNDAYQIYLTSTENGRVGHFVELTLNMKNQNPINTWQCTIVLPEGITYWPGRAAKVPDRYPENSDVKISTTTNPDGSITLAYKGKEGTAMTDTNGAIATLFVRVADDIVVPANYTILVKDNVLIEPDGTLHTNDWTEFVWSISGFSDYYVETNPWFENSLYLTGANGKVGHNAILTLNLKNSKEISAWACNPILPEGIVIKSALIVPDRYPSSNFDFRVMNMSDGSPLIICSGGQNKISGNDGAVAIIMVSIPDDFVPGNYAVKLNKISLSTPAAESVADLNATTFAWTIESASNKSYTINFDTNGGSPVESITQNVGSVITPPADPTREGYTFLGWEPALPETMPEGGLTVTAQWAVNKYTLTYILDGEEYKSYEIDYDTPITPEPEPERNGYIFSGWSEIPETMPAHDVTVTGTFTLDIDTDISALDNVIYIDNNVKGFVGQELTLSFRMKNSAAIRGFQFDLYLPEGITAVKNAKGRIQGSLSSGRLPEDDEHTLTLQEQPDGAIRFLCGSQYDETFTGNEGEIATLQVSIAEDMEDGEYSVILKNMRLSETDISKFYDTQRVKTTLTIFSYTLGDINGDGVVNVSDYIGIANHILGSTPTGFIEKAADVNEDNTINVSDYIGVANIILTGSPYGNSSNAKPAYLKATGANLNEQDNVIYVEPLSVDAGTQSTLSFMMKNTAAIRGFQFDLYLPEGVTVVKNAKGRIQGSLSSGRLPEDDEHTLTIQEQPDGAIRFLCGSQYDETFTGNAGEIATLQVNIADGLASGDYPIVLRNMRLSETDISKFYDSDNVETTLTVKSGEKCATPTIAYANGKLKFSCETEGVQFASTITDDDIKSYDSEEIDLVVTYTITVYATKDGCDNSDLATATLCWIDAEPKSEGLDEDAVMEVKALPILIQTQGGTFTIQGATEGTSIAIYSVDGKQYGSAIAEKDSTTIFTTLQPGSVAVVKIGEKAVKVLLK